MRVTVVLVVMVTNDPASSLSHFSTPLSAITVAKDFPIYTSQRSALPLIVVKGLMYLSKIPISRTHIYIYIYIYIHTYTHTHTHTCMYAVFTRRNMLRFESVS